MSPKGLATFAVWATVLTAATAFPISAHSTDGGAGPDRSPTYEYNLNATGLAASVAASGLLDLQVWNGTTVRLALHEVHPVLPSENYILELDETGKVLSNTSWEGRSFRGTVLGAPMTKADLRITNWGVYGTVSCSGYRHELDPKVTSGQTMDSSHVTEIVVRGAQTVEEATVARPMPRQAAGDVAGFPSAGQATETSQNTCRPSCAPGCATPGVDWRDQTVPGRAFEVNPPHGYHLSIGPWTTTSYSAYAPNFANRIALAISHEDAVDMWWGETSISVASTHLTVTHASFPGGSCGSGGNGDDGLNSFKSYLAPPGSPRAMGANYWILFDVESNPGSGVGGCGSQELSRDTVLDSAAAYAAISAKDWYSNDS
jgi:hypothetical protein